MKHEERSYLVLGELVRPLEIIRLHFFLRFFGLDLVRIDIPGRKRRKQLIYLRLR